MPGPGAGLGRSMLGWRPAARQRWVGVSAVSRDCLAGGANAGRADVSAESLSCFAHTGAQGHGDLVPAGLPGDETHQPEWFDRLQRALREAGVPAEDPVLVSA